MWKFIKYCIWFAILVLIGYFLLFLKPATFLPNDDRVAPLTETAQEREDARQEAIENIPDVSDSFIDPSSDASGVFTPQEIIIPDDWVTYTNEEIGFEFSYPPEYGDVIYDGENNEGYFSNGPKTKDYHGSEIDSFFFEIKIEDRDDLRQSEVKIHGLQPGFFDERNNGYSNRGDEYWYTYRLNDIFNMESYIYFRRSAQLAADHIEIFKSFEIMPAASSGFRNPYSDTEINRLIEVAMDPALEPHTIFALTQFPKITTNINELASAYKGNILTVEQMNNLGGEVDENIKKVEAMGYSGSPEWRLVTIATLRKCVIEGLFMEKESVAEFCVSEGGQYFMGAPWEDADDVNAYYETLPYVIDGLDFYKEGDFVRSQESFRQVIDHLDMLVWLMSRTGREEQTSDVYKNYESNLQIANDMIAHIESL